MSNSAPEFNAALNLLSNYQVSGSGFNMGAWKIGTWKYIKIRLFFRQSRSLEFHVNTRLALKVRGFSPPEIKTSVFFSSLFSIVFQLSLGFLPPHINPGLSKPFRTSCLENLITSQNESWNLWKISTYTVYADTEVSAATVSEPK